MHRLFILLLVALLLVLPTAPGTVVRADDPGGAIPAATPIRLFLPLVLGPPVAPVAPAAPARRVYAPYFNVADVDTKYPELAVFWFGKVNPTDNYTDVRVGYNDSELYITLAVMDRRLWFSDNPSPASLTNWDAATIYLNVGGATTPDAGVFRFDAQLSGDGGSRYQAAYRGNGSSWTAAAIPFTATPGWRGDRLNDNGDDKGWAMAYRIPFASLGLTGRPADGVTWGLAVRVHDRDDAAGTSIAPQTWPPAAEPLQPAAWGGLTFGLPVYTPPPAASPTTFTIRHRLNGANVPDGAVGGGTDCGGGMDYWTQWGEAVYHMLPDSPGEERGDFNIQNQSDISDWPCFSKYYVTFPLSALPAGRVVVSATVTLHQFGNSQPQDARPSLIQVLTVDSDWNEATLNWNNAPLAVTNVGRAWVGVLNQTAPWPGVARTWDISQAAAQAYASGTPLRLAFYSADNNYHSGKYFVSSDTGDWNAQGRPTLKIILGTPAGN